MKTQLSRALATILIVLFSLSPAWATCGGGGGGGTGGVAGGNSNTGPAPTVYKVPWKIWEARTAPNKGLGACTGFPQAMTSSRNQVCVASRILTLYSAQCVAMTVADAKHLSYNRSSATQRCRLRCWPVPMALRSRKSKTLAANSKSTRLRKLVEGEMKQRETALDTQLKDAKEKIKAGDNAGAIALLKPVAEEKCLFPKKAKDAAKELKKLGVEEIGSIPAAPILDRVARCTNRSSDAQWLDEQRSLSDTSPPKGCTEKRIRWIRRIQLRFVISVNSIDITPASGTRRERLSITILNMPADSVARAVALHGLGKMTIHDGEFKKGLSLMEQSVAEFPLALAYRNLAVYWNSEGDLGTGQCLHAEGTRARPERSIQPRVCGSVHGSFRAWR